MTKVEASVSAQPTVVAGESRRSPASRRPR
jgi:hypothetical protein